MCVTKFTFACDAKNAAPALYLSLTQSQSQPRSHIHPSIQGTIRFWFPHIALAEQTTHKRINNNAIYY